MPRQREGQILRDRYRGTRDLSLERVGRMLLYRMRHTPHETDIIDAEPAYLGEPRTCECGQQQARTVAGVHRIVECPYLRCRGDLRPLSTGSGAIDDRRGTR